mgnify:CR=1 FL=1
MKAIRGLTRYGYKSQSINDAIARAKNTADLLEERNREKYAKIIGYLRSEAKNLEEVPWILENELPLVEEYTDVWEGYGYDMYQIRKKVWMPNPKIMDALEILAGWGLIVEMVDYLEKVFNYYEGARILANIRDGDASQRVDAYIEIFKKYIDTEFVSGTKEINSNQFRIIMYRSLAKRVFSRDIYEDE